MVVRRNTWQREAVREALDTSEGFVSAQALHTHLRESGSPIGLATVYRALADLAADGSADSLQQEVESLYRACTPGTHHHHLICRACSRMVDVDCAVGDTPCLTAADDAGYEVDEAEVIYWGRCPECVAANSDLKETLREETDQRV